MIVEEQFSDEWDKFNMWGLKMKNPEETFRAYSMANHPAEGNIIMLNIRIATPPWDRAKGSVHEGKPGNLFILYFLQETRRQSDDLRALW